MVFVLTDIAQEFDTDVTARHRRHSADPGDAADRRLPVRPRGRPLGPPADLDGRRAALLGDRIRFRLRAEPDRAADAARDLRHRHGRRMGRRRLAHHGIASRRRRAASSPACCNRAIRPDISSPRSSTALLFQYIGWRGMFMVGVIPALLVLYIRRSVPESPSWTPTDAAQRHAGRSANRTGGSASTRSLLMTAFNFFSHGTQDLYPTFLQVQHGFSPHEVGLIAVDLQYRRDHRRHFLRLAVGTFRPRRMHHHRRGALARRAAAVGLCRDRGVARGRRVPDAGHGAGRLGRRSRCI